MKETKQVCIKHIKKRGIRMKQKERENQEKLFDWFKGGEEKTVIEKMKLYTGHKDKEDKSEWSAYNPEFDFKYLMEEYYRFYQENVWGDMLKKWENICGSIKDPDPIKLWYAYKTADEEYKPQGMRFDCDSWNGTNDLMDKIYDLLWRDQKVLDIYDMRKKFGGDTMNSFATTFNALAGTISAKKSEKDSFKISYEKYIKDPSSFGALEDYAKYTGCLGNFTLVPNGYNGYRGLSKKLADYWDLSLHNLRYNKDGNDWLENVDMTFREYINIFFLWDYVGEKYKVRPLFQRHTALLTPEDMVRPRISVQTTVNKFEEFQEFTSNANKYIRRRGIFMAAMLEIASKREDDYSKILNALAVDKCLGSMEEVLTMLKKNRELTKETKQILERCENKLKELENKEDS